MAEVSTNTGWISASSATNYAVQGFSWSGLANVSASDNSRASATVPNVVGSSTTDFLNCAFSNLASAIPADATIDGVEVRVEGYFSSTMFTGMRASLCSDSVGTALSGTSAKTNSGFPVGSSTNEAYATFGGDGDLWGGSSISVSDLASSAFRLPVRAVFQTGAGATAYVDHAQIRVYYTYTEPDESGIALFWSAP